MASTGSLEVSTDGIEHRVVTLPIVANLDGTDHVEPIVERSFVQFQAAKEREEAVRHADRGDFDAAAGHLMSAAGSLRAYLGEAGVAAEIQDLEAEASRMKDRIYLAADRKYHLAKGHAALHMKARYADKLSRKRPEQ